MDVAMAEPGEILPERKIDYTAYDKLQESKASLEEIVSKMLSIKRQGNNKSELREYVTNIFLNFVTLRQSNRTILLQEDHVKSETERAKAPVDFTTLQLHNLMYEKNHYVKAIKACKDFKSKYPDIELVPEEEFLRDAPEEIKTSVISTDTAHNSMLKRLNYELFQRKELCKLRDRLEQKKKALQETIANRKKFLTSLPSHLKSLKKASLPLQNQLGVLHTKKMKQQQLAELLPPPLYVIYSQIVAQKEAFGEHIDLEIVGSIKDAQAFARQLAIKDTGLATTSDSSKLEDDIPEEDDEGQRRRKRPKKVPSKENLDQTGIYQAHPLKVILHVNDDEALDQNAVKLLTLRFEYLTKLNVVCVGVEGSQESADHSILCNLFPDDTGLELPHQSAKLCLADGIVFSDQRTSRPYKWTQHLAGIDFLPEVSPLSTASATSDDDVVRHDAVVSGLSVYRNQNRVQTVVQRIRSRKKAQLALMEQLDSVMKLKWPGVTCKSVPWASHSPKCSLISCKPVSGSPSQALPVPNTEQVPATLAIDKGEKSSLRLEIGTNREDGELPYLNPVGSATSDAVITPTKNMDLEHSMRMSLISKNVISPMTMGKSPSFRKHEDDVDLILDSDSELDEPAKDELETEDVLGGGEFNLCDRAWINVGVREYCLVLTRKSDNDDKTMNMEALIKISMEYPIRPPHFTLNIRRAVGGESDVEFGLSEWYNELRSIEAEINVNIIQVIPFDQENFTFAHQVHCLAMLFDFYLDDAGLTSEKRKNTSAVDIGMCLPGNVVSRTFRGRDRKKMISWKGNN
ncbi:hypothetical protein Leryth_025088 [Lithospermum erythrorhizon]|nr:hypothetical protein Leryth_025088 [Lithospermum erythrorhizon]